jgi:hypothetical protein
MGANKKNNGRPRVFPTTQLTQNGPSLAKVAAYHPPGRTSGRVPMSGCPNTAQKLKTALGMGRIIGEATSQAVRSFLVLISPS